jgi:hypothetical protein
VQPSSISAWVAFVYLEIPGTPIPQVLYLCGLTTKPAFCWSFIYNSLTCSSSRLNFLTHTWMGPQHSPSNTQITDSEFSLATSHSCVCVCVCVCVQVWLLVHSWITSGTHYWTHMDCKEHIPLQFKGFWQVAFVNGKCVPQFHSWEHMSGYLYQDIYIQHT